MVDKTIKLNIADLGRDAVLSVGIGFSLIDIRHCINALIEIAM